MKYHTKKILLGDLAYALVISVLSTVLGLPWQAYGTIAFYLTLATIAYAILLPKRPEGLKKILSVTRWFVVMKAGAWIYAVMLLTRAQRSEIGINLLLAAVSIGLVYYLLVQWRLVLKRGNLVKPMDYKYLLLAIVGIEIVKTLVLPL